MIAALETLVSSAYAWKTRPSRKLKLWSDGPAASRPAGFIFEGWLESYAWSELALPKRALEAKLFIYLWAKGDSIGASLLNGVMDSLDEAFVLSGADLTFGRNTLAGRP